MDTNMPAFSVIVINTADAQGNLQVTTIPVFYCP